MDATTAPHIIPPEMPQYGEENHIFELMQVTGSLGRGVGVRGQASESHVAVTPRGLRAEPPSPSSDPWL
jgi:hypothetical protein